MREKFHFWATNLVLAVALGASAILLVDYVRHAPVFCDVSGGCQAVKATIFARPFGIPLPAIGIAGLFGIGLTALIPGRGARIAQAAFAIPAGAFALLLLAVQAHMGTFCPFCVVVDTMTVAVAIASIVRLVTGWDPPSGRLIPGLAATAMIACVGAPIGVGWTLKPHPKPPPVALGPIPQPIADEMKLAGAKVSVVDFVDFECPFCRMTHADLEPVLAQHKDKVRLVRKHVPLRIHAHAMDAARAGCCGESLGRGAELADALFHAPPEELTPEGCEKLAQEQGLDLEKFRACVRDPATQARIESDRATFRAVQGHGLPTIWVDGTKLEGAQDGQELAAALDAALHARQL
jgi:protein-disulfide isomerase/uncharacterized membrane protein